MQIGTSQLFSSAYKRMSQLSTEAARYNAEIATGKKVQTASDDTVAFGRLTRLSRTTANEKQYASNMKLAGTLLQQSDDALDAVTTQVQRVRELALRASSDTLSASDRAAISTELDGVVDAIMGIANTTDARGVPLFAGADGQTPFAKDADGKVVFHGQGEAPAIPISATGTVTATSSGARVFGGIRTADGGTSDLFTLVQNLATALNGSDEDARKAAVAQSLTDLNSADESITNARASVGARAARVDLESNQLSDLADAREAERSSLEEADTTESVVNLQKISTILQATQASFSKLSQLSLFNYLS